VGIGGAAGVAARFLITDAAAPRLSQPVVTLMINIAGCLLLGVLLEALARAGDDHGIRRNLRLLLGTGVLGGFTTYSTFAVDTATLVGPHPGLAVLYGLGSILLGCLAAAAGVWIAGGAHRHRARGGRR
jgi:CrcB protein